MTLPHCLCLFFDHIAHERLGDVVSIGFSSLFLTRLIYIDGHPHNVLTITFFSDLRKDVNQPINPFISLSLHIDRLELIVLTFDIIIRFHVVYMRG